MKQKLLYNLIFLMPFFCIGQTTNFRILPFMNGITSIKEGIIEAGPEFNWENNSTKNVFTAKPFIRIPLTNKAENILQIDRFSTTWRGVLSLQYTVDNTKASGVISRNAFNGQFEYGSSNFKYYPTANKANENKSTQSSYAFEIKYIGFFTNGTANATQISPQVRIRYSYDWKASDEVGVVNAPNNNGIVTTTNMVIDEPTAKPTFSPAFSLQFYPGRGSYSYSPTVYYDFTGEAKKNDPFNNLNRLRIETWIFFYPIITNVPNVKIGISPFLSIRTKGVDKFNKVEYGGMLTIKFGTTFLQFL